MRALLSLIVVSLLRLSVLGSEVALSSHFDDFVQDYCLQCHQGDDATRLDIGHLPRIDLGRGGIEAWAKVYDKLVSQEMPPADEPQPTDEARSRFIEELHSALSKASSNRIAIEGRVPVRRLTATEVNYSLHDLLGIAGNYVDQIPRPTNESLFDTLASSQHLSASHLHGFLDAADRAIDAAIQIQDAQRRSMEFDLADSKHLNTFHERALQAGGNISFRKDDGVVVFRDVDYLVRSDLLGFRVRKGGGGLYRVTVAAESFQSDDPVALKLVTMDVSGESQIAGAIDLLPGQSGDFSFDVFLDRSMAFYVSLDEERLFTEIFKDIMVAGGARQYKGPGIYIKRLHIEGPIRKTKEDWLSETSQTEPVNERVDAFVRNWLPKILRRPATKGELYSIVHSSKDPDSEELRFPEAIRSPLRTMLSSPQFLLLSGPPGPLDNHALASRLSYFLWKSIPDRELRVLADRGELSRPENLTAQVDRMLDDPRSSRFIRDFAGQWLRLDELNKTRPDEKLYPEYDHLLHWSIAKETEGFLHELIDQNLSARNLIDSDFAMLNRRLAEHYGVDGVVGQDIRRVQLPVDSVRGGLITQASILKITANGLTTSPVRRGEFVLSQLLGTPPPPAPAGLEAIEVDTTGATTIRELLALHRDRESCARCHRTIDPPGFALESFDPTGAYRTHYRHTHESIFSLVTYREGPPVDSSGVTHTGAAFSGIRQYRDLLIDHSEDIIRHFITMLIVYATGGEITFADRAEVDKIFRAMREQDFPVRSIIHAVVQSRMFRHR